MLSKLIGNSRRIIYQLDVVVFTVSLIYPSKPNATCVKSPKITDILAKSSFGEKYSDIDPPHPGTCLILP